MDNKNEDSTIEELTKAAEDGRGSVVKEALDKVTSLEDRVHMLKLIDKANAKHRETDPQLPDLVISTSVPFRAPYVELQIMHDPPGWYTFNATTIYREVYDPSDNKRTTTATDTKR